MSREALVEDIINSIQRSGIDDAVKEEKKRELEKYVPMHNIDYYESKVMLSIPDFDNFMPYLEVVETPKQHELWNTLRVCTSSVATSKNPGRCVRILVKDKVSGNYIGVLALGSDLYAYNARDKYIDWDFRDSNRRNTIYNIWSCVGLQPLAFNYNIGKLLCHLCFSKEMMEILENQYTSKVSTITTFGINGKSIQYEKLKVIKLVGFTKGYGTCHLSDDLLARAKDELSFELDGMTSKSKLDVWKRIFKILDIPSELLKHQKQRGVYVGFTSSNSKDFLQGKCQESEMNYSHVQSIVDITKWWTSTNARKRFSHLATSNRLKPYTKPEWTYPIVSLGQDDITINITKEYIDGLPKLSDTYIAGLLDGDGAIMYDKCMKCPKIEVSQCDPQVALILQRDFGGYITIRPPKNNTQRQQFMVTVRRSKRLYEICAAHCIIKERRAVLALRLYVMLVENIETTNKESLETILKEFDVAKTIYSPSDDDMYNDRMCPLYIAGFFDAEGCIYARLYKGVTVTVTQKNCPHMLKSINHYMSNIGSLNDVRLCFHSKSGCFTFIHIIREYTVIKRDQLDAYYENYLSNEGFGCIVNILSKMKAKRFTIDQELLDQLNQDHKPTRCLRKLNKLFSNGEPSVPRKKPVRTIAHTVNVVLGNLNSSRREGTDTTITKVQTLLAQGKKQAEIIKEYNLSRGLVNKIARNLVLPGGVTAEEVRLRIETRNEAKEYRQSLSEEERKRFDIEKVAISKRGYTMQQCIETLQYIRDNNRSILFSKLCIDPFTKERLGNIVTGDTRLYRREFATDEEFKAYTDLLEEVMSLDWKEIGNRDRSIKNRKSSPDIILAILNFKKDNPSKSMPTIAEHFDIKESTIRGVLNGSTKIHHFEFPINGVTYDDYVALCEAV